MFPSLDDLPHQFIPGDKDHPAACGAFQASIYARFQHLPGLASAGVLFLQAQNLPLFMHTLPTFCLYYNNYSTGLS